jgi:hypothetical protein
MHLLRFANECGSPCVNQVSYMDLTRKENQGTDGFDIAYKSQVMFACMTKQREDSFKHMHA